MANGRKILKELLDEFSKPSTDMNEAETRFHLIDKIINSCLGWPKDLIHVEVAQERKYTDYELGEPRLVIWEAKREGKTFELPANPDKNLLVDLPSILLLGQDVKDAINQVQDYCSNRGVQIAVVTNGHQFIAFLATRFDGKAPLKCKSIVINSLTHLYQEFPTFWQLLSYDGIREKRIIRLLSTGEMGLPIKLSSKLIQYPQIRFQNDIQSTLKQVSELLIQDLSDSESIEEEFMKQCYCESGALSKYALVSKNILNARYSAMFDEKKPHPKTTPINPKKNKTSFTPDIMAEAISKRPIVLIGDVGVGKTSFVKHLKYTTAHQEFKNAIYIYIDLGSKASLTESLKNYILSEIEEQLYSKYSINVSKEQFVREVYSDQIRRFDSSIYGSYKKNNPEKYNDKLIDHLAELISVKDQHLKRAIQYISHSQKKQTIICVDNADQRSFEIQQDAFIISQELAKDWTATVFLAVRPQTFYKSKQSGALTAYPHKVFTISPPRVDTVIEKRLRFALSMAEGKIPVSILENVSLDVENLSIFLRTLIFSLGQNKDLTELLTNITGGNIRAVVELVTKFIGSPNVDAEKIIKIEKEKGSYLIPVHEFSKSALLGDYSHYNPETSLAMNTFDVSYPDPKEHFLLGMILGYLASNNTPKNNDGFVQTDQIMDEFQAQGFTVEQLENSLRRATNKKVIETSQRLTFAEDETGLIGEMPTSFRINTIGAYHSKRWMYSFAYLDAMVFDTPIFDDSVMERLVQKAESFYIGDRYERAVIFKEYLLSSWTASGLNPNYFDLAVLFSQGNDNFEYLRQIIKNNEQ